MKKLNKQEKYLLATKAERSAVDWVKGNHEIMGVKIGNIISIVVNILMIWVAHNITSWNHPIFDFVKPQFDSIVWAINLSSGMAIVANLIRIFTSDKIIASLTRIVEYGFTIFLILVILPAFPYDFSKLIPVPWINELAVFGMIIGIIGTVVAIIVEIFKIFNGNVNYIKKEKIKSAN